MTKFFKESATFHKYQYPEAQENFMGKKRIYEIQKNILYIN